MNQNYLNKLLFLAICQYNVEDVKKMLKMGADVNSFEKFPFCWDFLYMSPLEYSINLYLSFVDCCFKRVDSCLKKKIFEIITVLVENGANLNLKRKFYNSIEKLTILQFLSIAEYVDENFGSELIQKNEQIERIKNIFELFIKNGANINSTFEIWDYSSDESSILERFCYERTFIEEKNSKYDKIIKLLILNGSNFLSNKTKRIIYNRHRSDCDCSWLDFFEEWPQLILYFCFKKKNIKIFY
jgi:hypothetical protein